MKTYSLYLSTTSTASPPTSKTSLSNVSLSVNWDETFGTQTGVCSVRLRMNTISGTYTDTHNGSLRASFSSSHTNSNYGINIAPTLITALTSTLNVLLSDTFYTNGLTINIPKGNGAFTISFVDRNDALMTGVQNYQVWFYFDVYDRFDL